MMIQIESHYPHTSEKVSCLQFRVLKQLAKIFTTVDIHRNRSYLFYLVQELKHVTVDLIRYLELYCNSSTPIGSAITISTLCYVAFSEYSYDVNLQSLDKEYDVYISFASFCQNYFNQVDILFSQSMEKGYPYEQLYSWIDSYVEFDSDKIVM